MNQQVIECFKALGDPIRYEIYQSIVNQERCACEFGSQIPVSQPTLSFHLKKLTECGLLIMRKDGVRQYYTVNQELVQKLKTSF